MKRARFTGEQIIAVKRRGGAKTGRPGAQAWDSEATIHKLEAPNSAAWTFARRSG